MSLKLSLAGAAFTPLRLPRPSTSRGPMIQLPQLRPLLLRRETQLLPLRVTSVDPSSPAEAGEGPSNSISRAFSSMVLIIRELLSHALELPEQGIPAPVQREIHASFCWLFHQIFSRTPTLMISLMLLLANFSLHSVTLRPASAAPACLTRLQEWREVEEEEERWRCAEEFRREMAYRRAVEEEPCNGLLLSNYAQFLFLVARDLDRAEHYFNRAIQQKPPDPETLGRYARFAWMAKGDLLAAEEMYVEAIATDPSNTYRVADYAHFLWSSGGEDTCVMLDDQGYI